MTAPPFSRIIVPLDGGPEAERAIPVASVLAEQAGVAVILVRVVPPGASTEQADAYLDQRRASMTGTTDQMVLRGIPASEALIDYLGPQSRALVCCTTHARSALGELLLGSMAEELMRQNEGMTLLVGSHASLPAPGDRYRELVVCIEDDSLSRPLVSIGRDLCLTLNLHPWLLQVLEPLSEQPAGADEESLHRSNETLAAAGVHAGQRIAFDRDVPHTISTFAAALTAPIVAVSSRKRSLKERLRDGSVAVGVARTAHCPLLVIGPSYASDDSRLRRMHTTA